MTNLSPRIPTPVDALAEEYFDASVALSPITATFLGVPGFEDRLDDFSPDGYAAQAQLRAATLAKLAAAQPVDGIDRVTIAAMQERLGLAQEIAEAGLDTRL